MGGSGGDGVRTLCGEGELEGGAGAVYPERLLLVELDEGVEEESGGAGDAVR